VVFLVLPFLAVEMRGQMTTTDVTFTTSKMAHYFEHFERKKRNPPNVELAQESKLCRS